MATNKSLSPHYYYHQIAHPILTAKFRCQSSDISSSNINIQKVESQNKQKQVNKTTKMKKSQNFEIKPIQATLPIHRRFSFFRFKRSHTSNENLSMQALQQTIDQLRQDLQTKNDELEVMKEHIENKSTTDDDTNQSSSSSSNQSLEQAMQLQALLNARLKEMLIENDLLKRSIEQLESLAHEQQTPNSPGNTSVLTTSFNEPNNPIIKSTNFTSSVPISRSEIRHKSEIEIEVKQEKPQQQQQQLKNPISNSSYPPIIRPTEITNKRVPTIFIDENAIPSQYPTAKRRFITNSVQTQTQSLVFNQQDHQLQQQLKSLTDETLSKNEKIQVLLRELGDCQAIIKQQDQQLVNDKKERDQLCLVLDERTNELRNLKQKNEQLEQMIRNEKEHSKDEKKLFSLLKEAQEERDNLLNQQRQSQERIQKLEEQIKHYESDVSKMRDSVLCSKIKLDKKTDENQYLNNQLNEMKKFSHNLEHENQKFKLQIEYEKTKHDESNKLKTIIERELENTMEKFRTQQYDYETKISTLDESLKYSQKQYHSLQQNQRLIEDKHAKEIHEFKQHIKQLEIKIEEVIKDKAFVSIRCGELIELNHKLEKTLNDNEKNYEEKLNDYKHKNSLLSTQIDEFDKKFNETKKQLELMTVEKDETLADMLIAVRVASELRHDAEDRLNKANDDLKRFTEHIEQEREVQRRQMQLASSNRNSNGYCDFGHVRIKEMIRTIEANSRHTSIKTSNYHIDTTVRQRPVSQPCTRTETNAVIINQHHHPRQFDTSTDDAKILSSTKNDSPLLNHTHRTDASNRSITNEQYDEMKSIVEAVFARMPGSVCKRDALLKWCGERLKNYGISITNFSNSWTDGIAFCALLHSYLPDRIDLEMIEKESKKKRFEIAFDVANSVGIVSILDIDEMCSCEWPDWERVMYYVALIFRHFESSTDNSTLSPILPIPQATSSPMSPTFSNSPSSTTSPSICASLRTTNSIPTTLSSPLQTV